MDKELILLLEKMLSYSDEALIAIANNGSPQFRPEVIELAKAVMISRGCSLNKKGQVVKNKNSKPPAQKIEATAPAAAPIDAELAKKAGELNRALAAVFCPRCRQKLDYVGTRRLQEDRDIAALGELGQMYKTGAHEFLDVYICNRCGHAEFFVDGIGEELRPY